ncbi:hypothetical protein XH89_18240 [Bradyrhizobium sp. CCBAU 53340]|nr:hypothetical protein XH89_18240 [Bradyrhizobium sp. CCBAU 53340]
MSIRDLIIRRPSNASFVLRATDAGSSGRHEDLVGLHARVTQARLMTQCVIEHRASEHFS